MEAPEEDAARKNKEVEDPPKVPKYRTDAEKRRWTMAEASAEFNKPLTVQNFSRRSVLMNDS